MHLLWKNIGSISLGLLCGTLYKGVEVKTGRLHAQNHLSNLHHVPEELG